MWGYEAEHHKPGHLDRVFSVLEVGYAWGKVNEPIRAQKTRPIWVCFPFSGEGGDMWGYEIINPAIWTGLLCSEHVVGMGEGKRTHPNSENTSHMGGRVFHFQMRERIWGDMRQNTINPAISTGFFVFWTCSRHGGR